MDVRKKIILFIIGLFLLGLGISCTILAANTVGIGAWDVINIRLNNLFPVISIGTWLFIVAGILTVVSGFIYGKIPNFLCLGASLLIGFTVDFTLLFLNKIASFLPDYIFFAIGLILIAVGTLIYLESQFVVSPIDYLMQAIIYRFKLPIGIAKTTTEIIAITIALLIGGKVSYGTFISMIALGPLFAFFDPIIKNLIHRKKPEN